MISKGTTLRVFARSFFLQSAWSFERMQGLGFASAISPAIKELFKDKHEESAALRRHLGFYNLHPYMASPVLGAAITLEQDGRGQEAVELKNSVMGPYGAIGDMFFWGSLRPLVSAIAVLIAFFYGFWAPVAFVLLYNVVHIRMRWTGLKKGLELGPGVIGYVEGLELPTWAIRARYALAAILGAVAVLIASGVPHGVPPIGMGQGGARVIIGTVVVISSVSALSVLLRRGVTVSRLFYIVALPLVLYGFWAQVQV